MWDQDILPSIATLFFDGTGAAVAVNPCHRAFAASSACCLRLLSIFFASIRLVDAGIKIYAICYDTALGFDLEQAQRCN
jgi:hypothetical protein